MHVVFIGSARCAPSWLSAAFGREARLTYLELASESGDFVVRGLPALAPDLVVVNGQDALRDQTRTVQSARDVLAGRIPIFMMAASGGATRVEDYLHAGADGCMRHPIAAAEFRERVAALMRRQGFLNAERATRFGDYEFAELGRTVSYGRHSVTLRRTEFRLALYLFRNAGRVVSRDELTRVAACRTLQDDSRTLDTHLSRIRHALCLNQVHRPLLRSIYAQGYFLSLNASPTPRAATPQVPNSAKA